MSFNLCQRPTKLRTNPLTLTLTLNRSDQSGFNAYLKAVEDPSSYLYHYFLKESELTRLFGPSDATYDSVISWLKSEGFALVQGSTDHLTITVKGSRSNAVRAFDTPIATYKMDGREIYANTSNPGLPVAIASEVHSVTGLSDAGQPTATPERNPRSYGVNSSSSDLIFVQSLGIDLFHILSIGGLTKIGPPVPALTCLYC